MEHFITVIFEQRKASKKVLEAIRTSANLTLTESSSEPIIFESDAGGIGFRMETPYSFTDAQSEIVTEKLANKLFEMGYDNFDIETTINEAGQKRPELDAIIDRYAKPGMSLQDLSSMVQEAVNTKQADFDPNAQGDDRNILQRVGDVARDVGNSISRRVDSADFRKRYVLAHASWKLGLSGLYDPEGRYFYYIEDGTGEPKGASGGSLTQALEVAQAGLLPPAVMEKINKNFKRFDNVQPGDTQGRRTQQKLNQIRNQLKTPQAVHGAHSFEMNTRLLDSVRKENLFDIIPEIKDHVQVL